MLECLWFMFWLGSPLKLLENSITRRHLGWLWGLFGHCGLTITLSVFQKPRELNWSVQPCQAGWGTGNRQSIVRKSSIVQRISSHILANCAFYEKSMKFLAEIGHTIMYIFGCGGKSDLTSEGTVRGQIQDGHQSTGSNVHTRLIFEPNSVEKHLRCHFQLNCGCPFIWWYFWDRQNPRTCI